MNKERILELADAIEQGRIVEDGVPVGFNMAYWNGELQPEDSDISGKGCGTVACIGGSAELVFPGEDAGDALALDFLTEELLFYPRSIVPPHQWGRIPVAAAVWCLRNLAEAGEVDWPKAIAQHPLLPA